MRIANLKSDVKYERQEKDLAQSSLNQERKSRRLEAFAREQYLADLEKAENEKQRLETCIANKSCVRTIRVRVPVSVPSTGSADGTEEITAQLSPTSTRIIADLEYRIKQWEAWAAMCQKTLFDWSTTNPSR